MIYHGHLLIRYFQIPFDFLKKILTSCESIFLSSDDGYQIRKEEQIRFFGDFKMGLACDVDDVVVSFQKLTLFIRN